MGERDLMRWVGAVVVVGLMAGGCSTAGVPGSTPGPGSSLAPVASLPVASSSLPVASASASNPLCDAHVSSADIAAAAGAVGMVQAAEVPSFSSGSPKDLSCIYALASGQTVKFHVIHERVGTTTSGGSIPALPSSVAKILANGGAAVPGLGLAAASIVLNGTPILGWEVSVAGFDTVSYTLEGATADALVAIARRIH